MAVIAMFDNRLTHAFLGGGADCREVCQQAEVTGKWLELIAATRLEP
jgi:hypothetical protein